jgi:outer membrane lipoprotein
MERNSAIKLLFFVLLAGMLVGCSLPISESLRSSARKDLVFLTVLEDAKPYVGSTVIWGGKIIKTTNAPEGSELIILQTPLKATEEPHASAYSEGRFIAKTKKFLDPEVFTRGRKVTVAGELIGSQARPLDKIQYTYPVIEIKQIYAWNKPPAIDYDQVYYPPFWNGYVNWAYPENLYRPEHQEENHK